MRAACWRCSSTSRRALVFSKVCNCSSKSGRSYLYSDSLIGCPILNERAASVTLLTVDTSNGAISLRTLIVRDSFERSASAKFNIIAQVENIAISNVSGIETIRRRSRVRLRFMWFACRDNERRKVSGAHCIRLEGCSSEVRRLSR